jgi:hypothetical protein
MSLQKMRTVLLVVATLTIGACAKEAAMLTIYYFPLGAETLTPVTSENIESRGAKCVIAAPEEVGRIRAILDSAPSVSNSEAAFTNRAVRIKIIDGKGDGAKVAALIENEGGVRIGGGDRAIPQGALAQLKAIVERHCK